MANQISLDILARIVSKTTVSFWRPLAWREQAPTQSFGTNRDWVEIQGELFTGKLGSQQPASTLVIRETAFVPNGSSGGNVDDVLSLGNPSVVWTLIQPDNQPISPSYASPSYDATSPPVQLRVRTIVDGHNHDLNLRLNIVTYSPDNPPPPQDPIIIADVPEPLPQPAG